jgi:hypothetical protein
VKKDEMGRAGSTNGEKRNAYTYTYYIGGRARRKKTTKETKTLVGR